MSSPEHKKLIWDLIKDIKVGMLVTSEMEEHDGLRARPMHLVQDAYDGKLYFYTPKKDSKVFEIKEDNDICITFSDPSSNIYVSLTGKARLTEDSELIERYWNSWVEAWFEKGKADPDLAMLEVKINRGEHWNTKENALVQSFELAKANVLDEATPDIGENEKFGQ